MQLVKVGRPHGAAVHQVCANLWAATIAAEAFPGGPRPLAPSHRSQVKGPDNHAVHDQRFLGSWILLNLGPLGAKLFIVVGTNLSTYH